MVLSRVTGVGSLRIMVITYSVGGLNIQESRKKDAHQKNNLLLLHSGVQRKLRVDKWGCWLGPQQMVSRWFMLRSTRKRVPSNLLNQNIIGK